MGIWGPTYRSCTGTQLISTKLGTKHPWSKGIQGWQRFLPSGDKI